MAQRTIYIFNTEFEISYELVNIDKKYDNNSVLVFLHGWGSNKEIMKQAFGNYFKQYTHLYVDLPGFGKSNIPIPLTTEQYSKIIHKLLKELEIQNSVIFGHSFGGKIATLLKPGKLILLSSAGIRTKKSTKVKLKIATAKLINKYIPILSTTLKNILRSNDVKNADEKLYQTFKNVVDEDFSSIFEDFIGDTYIFWGIDDLITPISSGQEIHNKIKDSKFIKLHGDHFFFIKHGETIENELKL